MIVSGYLSRVLRGEGISKVISYVENWLIMANVKPSDFDAFAFRGMSGALIAPILAAKFNKNLLMVRKNTEGSHADDLVEGDNIPQRYIIVDDFVASGRTLRVTRLEVEEFNERNTLVGVILYLRSFYKAGELSAFGEDWKEKAELERGYDDGD